MSSSVCWSLLGESKMKATTWLLGTVGTGYIRYGEPLRE